MTRARGPGLRRAAAPLRRVALVGAVATAMVAGAGCVDISGGAVEVPWTLFAADGRGAINDCSCADPAIVFIRLKLEAPPTAPTQADPCATAASCRFSCARKTGATPFMIPPGDYLMSIEPEGADGAPLDPAVVKRPGPTARQVVRGAPTELDALELEAPCAASCHGADVASPCAPG